ncbi:Protein decapping 5 [Platanthera zijinensis]|uniref:Protein decapping 5 n=1 Tax=Platanthera zijinensis TaxID=2320716 RepID=A0AAP0GAM1_9ASPA
MAAEATKSGPSPDSYIGSLISLTSKSEIRYEGFLYNINTEESSIGLRNVRSFGTEGRKKDGQQLPASDKIYEFILFRGTDIKDLQVKASPPSHTTPIQNDPAIIQSHYSHPSTVPSSLPGNLSSLGNASVPEFGPNTAHLAVQSSFQGSLPTYQTSGGFRPWNATPSPPMANVSGLAPPLYWQGYYTNSGGLPHMQQPSLMRSPPGLAMPPMQQVLQFPTANVPLSSGSTNYPEFPPLFQGANSHLSSGSTNYSEFPSLFPTVGSNLSLASTSISTTLAPTQVTTTIASDMSPFLTSNKVPTTSLPVSIPSVILPPVASLAPSMEKSSSLSQNISSAAVSSKPRTGPSSSAVNQTEPLPVFPAVGSSSSKQAETSVPLVIPDQLIQLTPSTGPSSQSQSLAKIPDHAEVKRPDDRTKPLLSEPPTREDKAETKTAFISKEPILPLPSPAYHKYAHPAAKFPGEFDFAAMNEKFNKDEVWGNLGKSKAHSSHREEEEDEAEEFYEENSASLESDVKPVYVKDDFFDTLSSNSSQQTHYGRIRFSEQLKIDTETFGNFQRNRSAYGGGRGFRGGGGGRGRSSSYPGRSHGYSVRGRGHGINQA